VEKHNVCGIPKRKALKNNKEEGKGKVINIRD